MPNYCDNTLYITGPKVPEVLKTISGKNGRVIDFETIIPLTEPFGMKSGGINDLAILCATKPEDDIDKYATHPWVAKLGVKTQSDLCRWHGTTRQEMVEHGQQVLDKFNREPYGTEMTTLHWGTKWNAIDPRLVESTNNSKAKIKFATAWSPPVPVIEALGQRFPDHNFKLRYVGELNAFRGVLEIKHGVVTTDDYKEPNAAHHS
jgi:hypothetical protein